MHPCTELVAAEAAGPGGGGGGAVPLLEPLQPTHPAPGGLRG